MKPIFQGSAVVLATLALAACGGTEAEPEAADIEVVGEPTMEPTGEMGGMSGMEGMMQSGGMMQQMQTHMEMMGGVGADSLMVMMPEHRQMVANMLAQMNREMREMNMTTDGEWNATVDALRQDLIHLPEMTADELDAFLPEHQARINQLIEMHRSMMDSMNK